MSNAGNEYRLKKISEIQKQLENEKDKRKHLQKKYKKGIKVINVIDYILATSIMSLSIVGVSLLATIIAAPAVITTETITAGVGILFILSRQINRKLVTKVKKHQKLGMLAEEILNKISNHVSIALNDDKISSEEFSLILSAVNTYLETKEKLCATFKDSVDGSVKKSVENNVKNSVENSVKNSVKNSV